MAGLGIFQPRMDTDKHGLGLICVHPCPSVVGIPPSLKPYGSLQHNLGKKGAEHCPVPASACQLHTEQRPGSPAAVQPRFTTASSWRTVAVCNPTTTHTAPNSLASIVPPHKTPELLGSWRSAFLAMRDLHALCVILTHAAARKGGLSKWAFVLSQAKGLAHKAYGRTRSKDSPRLIPSAQCMIWIYFTINNFTLYFIIFNKIFMKTNTMNII